MKKLLPVAFGHRMTADAVAFGPAVIFGHVMCSKKFVEQREVNREVHVDGFFFAAVVPMMKAWRDEEFFEDAKPPAEQDHRKHRGATCYGLRSPHRQDRSRAKKLLAALKPTNFNFKAFVPLLLQHKLWPDTPSHHSQSYLHDQALDRKAISQFDADNRLLVENYLGNIQLMEQLTRLNTNLALLKMHLAQTQAAAKSTLEVEVCGLRVGDFKLLTFPGEITVQVGLNIKKAANDDHALVSGYTNGYIYYTPTAEQRLRPRRLRHAGGTGMVEDIRDKDAGGVAATRTLTARKTHFFCPVSRSRVKYWHRMNIKETHAAQIFLSHHDFVKGVALKYAPWPGLMEDITQQVFLEFMAKESKWDLSKDARPLLATMTRHIAMRQWRERTRQQPDVVQKLADHIRLLAEEREKPPRYEEEIGVLRTCLQKLPEKSRELVELYYYNDIGTPEIAEQINMKADTVCRALSRVREKLRDCIEQSMNQGGHAHA